LQQDQPEQLFEFVGKAIDDVLRIVDHGLVGE